MDNARTAVLKTSRETHSLLHKPERNVNTGKYDRCCDSVVFDKSAHKKKTHTIGRRKKYLIRIQHMSRNASGSLCGPGNWSVGAARTRPEAAAARTAPGAAEVVGRWEGAGPVIANPV